MERKEAGKMSFIFHATSIVDKYYIEK